MKVSYRRSIQGHIQGNGYLLTIIHASV